MLFKDLRKSRSAPPSAGRLRCRSSRSDTATALRALSCNVRKALAQTRRAPVEVKPQGRARACRPSGGSAPNPPRSPPRGSGGRLRRNRLRRPAPSRAPRVRVHGCLSRAFAAYTRRAASLAPALLHGPLTRPPRTLRRSRPIRQSCSDMVARARWRSMQPTRSPYVKDEGERLLPPPTRTRQTQIFAHSRRHRANLFSLSSCKTEFDRLRTMGGRRRFPGGHSAEGNRFRRVTSARPVCGFKPVDAKRRGRDRTDAAIDTTSEIRHRRHP